MFSEYIASPCFDKYKMNSMQIFFNLKNKVCCYLTFYSLFAKMGKVNNILSDKDQEEIINYLLSISKDGVLPRGAQATAFKKFAVKRSTLSRLWGKKADFRSKKKGKVGPITKIHVAERNTKNQRKGDLKEIPISVTKKVYANLLISKVIPS